MEASETSRLTRQLTRHRVRSTRQILLARVEVDRDIEVGMQMDDNDDRHDMKKRRW
jgi:hypothetical protein